MEQALQKHYLQIQTAIKNNIATIQVLVKQADSLRGIIDSIAESTANDTNKSRLEAEINKINETISTLVNNTESLFDVYHKFVQTLSDSK